MIRASTGLQTKSGMRSIMRDSTARWDVSRYTDFDRVRSVWNALNKQSCDLPLLDAEFFEIMLKHCGAPQNLVLAVAYRNDIPIAAGLFISERLGSWQTYQQSQAPLGAWVCSEHESLESLLAGLISSLPGYSLAVGVTQQDPDVYDRPKQSNRLLATDYVETGSIAIDLQFPDYWIERGKNLKKNVRWQRNKLARQDIETRSTMIVDPAAISVAVDQYGMLESDGWKAAEGTALHPENLQGRLYRNLMEHYAKSGEAFVYQYFYDLDLVGSQLCIHRNGVMYGLKTTYSEKITGTSPGVLMTEELFRSIFDSGKFHTIEFYGRKGNWQPKWTNQFRLMYHVTAYRFSTIRAMMSRHT